MRDQANIITKLYQSPCGTLILGSYRDKLCICDWERVNHQTQKFNRLQKTLNSSFEEGSTPIIEKTINQLDEYFKGERQSFEIPLLFVGTDFQKEVWNALLTIPFGHTISYGEMAQKIGRPKAVRAVANANGANALSILAPCHRVIGSNNSLTGYGGGLKVKEFLIKLESDR